MLIAACVAVLVAGLGAGIAYFRQHAGNPSASRTAPAAASASSTAQPATNDTNQLPATTPAGQPYIASGADVNSAARPAGNAPSVAAPSSSANNAAKAPAPTANHSPAPDETNDSRSDLGHGVHSAHFTSHHLDAWERRPDRSSSRSRRGLDFRNESAAGNRRTKRGALPMPTAQPEGPAKIGGNVKEPKLINSVAPAYPLARAQAAFRAMW